MVLAVSVSWQFPTGFRWRSRRFAPDGLSGDADWIENGDEVSKASKDEHALSRAEGIAELLG